MKSIVMAYLLIVLGSILTITFCWWIQFDHIQSMMYDNCKHALAYAMKQVKMDDSPSIVSLMEAFESYFKANAFNGFDYQVKLIGFRDSPLFASVEVKITGKAIDLVIRESMLEEVRDDA